MDGYWYARINDEDVERFTPPPPPVEAPSESSSNEASTEEANKMNDDAEVKVEAPETSVEAPETSVEVSVLPPPLTSKRK